METERAPVLQPYPWQGQQWSKFLRLSQAGRLPHALLFLGQPEIGKLDFAHAAAHYLLCHGEGKGDHGKKWTTYGCGKCAACLLFKAGSHPDFLFLHPEEPGKQLRIDTIRTLNKFTAARSHQGGWKVVLICPAESLNLSAANALLKTLEEPGQDTLIMLVTHRSGALLPTIRSRCQVMHFPSVTEELAKVWLSQAIKDNTADNSDETRMAQALLRADNRPLRALRYYQPEVAERIQDFEQMLERVAAGESSPMHAAEGCSKLEYGEALSWFTRLYVSRLRMLIKRKVYPGRGLQVFNDSLVRSAQRLTSTANLNAQMVWEELLVDWQRAWRLSPLAYRDIC